ncbi:MAG: aminoglycoside phosphotransferase family protein [Ilumatobacteraceae bacterium]
MADPGRLIGSGRAADVYDLGGERVLRRYKLAPGDGTTEREASVMDHLRRHGYPVPAVFDAGGTDLVMQRLRGTTMLDDLGTHPWRVDRHAALWATMVQRLGTVPVGELGELDDTGLAARFGWPEAVLHLDFHPGNIMLTADGPMVFDWTNAALGPAAADVAMAWVIGATSTVDGPAWKRSVAALIQRRMVDRFVTACGRAEAQAPLPAVADERLADRNVRPEEAARIRSLAASVS